MVSDRSIKRCSQCFGAMDARVDASDARVLSECKTTI